MFFVNWWNELLLSEQIFYCIAIASTLFLLIETVMMFMGFGDDGVSDGIDDVELPDGFEGDGIFGEDAVTEAFDASGLEGLRIFTVRGIVAFFVVFGWVGALMSGSGIGLFVTLPVSFISGFVMMIIMAYLFKAVLKLKSDGNTDNRNALGTAGKVHLTVPPKRTGEGKVHIMLQGSFVERNAVTDSEESIPTGSEVIVVGVSGETDLVVKRK